MAGRFSIEAVFKAKDRLTAPISKMQNRITKFTRSMERGLRKANRAVGKLGAALGKGVKAGAAIAVASITAVGLALNKTADSADALAKQSRRLEWPIEELQEWKFVADQSGVSSEQLDSALGAFSKRLGEAKAGTGPMVAGLKKIDRQLLRQMIQTTDVSEAFEIYIGAMRDADSATKKAALANAAFSRSGLNLVDISKNSAAQIGALRKEQRENGVLTMKQAEAAEAYNDAVGSLKRTMAGFMQSVLVPLMPLLTDIARTIREWAVANKELVSGKILKFGRDVVDNWQTIVKWAKRIGIALGVFVGLSIVLKTLIGILTLVNLVLAANPIVLIVLGVVALTVAIAALIALIIKNWPAITAFFVDLWESAMVKLSEFREFMSPFTEFMGQVWDAVVAQWTLAFELLLLPAKLAVVALQAIWETMQALATAFVSLWDPTADSWAILWDGLGDVVDGAAARIMAIVDKVKNAVKVVKATISKLGTSVGKFFGFADNDEPAIKDDPAAPQMVTPQARAAATIEEKRTTSTAEVTIRDESGRAEVTAGKLGGGINLQPSGAF